MTIRDAQLAQMGKSVLERFALTAAEHLLQTYPDETKACAPGDLLRGVRQCLVRASFHRLDTERDLLRYCRLGFMFGADFDTDPRLDWAADILSADQPASIRSDRLLAAALSHEIAPRGFAGQVASAP